MQQFTKFPSLIRYAALLLFLVCNLYAEHSGYFIISIPQKMAFAMGFFALWTLANFMRTGAALSEEKKQSRLRLYFFGLFLYYSWILSNMLFFDAAFGREANAVTAFSHLNLEPLRTIRNYLRAYELGNISGGLVVLNLLGNLAAFAPLGFFLPALFRHMRNFLFYFLTTTVLICSVESIQFISGAGSCDVDDLILNLTGALFVWLTVQLPPIRRRTYCALRTKQKRMTGRTYERDY